MVGILSSSWKAEDRLQWAQTHHLVLGFVNSLITLGLGCVQVLKAIPSPPGSMACLVPWRHCLLQNPASAALLCELPTESRESNPRESSGFLLECEVTLK